MACRFGPRHSNFRGEKAFATFLAIGERLARLLPNRVELGLFVTTRIPHESLSKSSQKTHTSLSQSSRSSVRLPHDESDAPVPQAWLVGRPELHGFDWITAAVVRP